MKSGGNWKFMAWFKDQGINVIQRGHKSRLMELYTSGQKHIFKFFVRKNDFFKKQEEEEYNRMHSLIFM